MMKKPQLLLLDEPTTYLDPLTSRRFLDAVDEMNRDFGLSVIIAEHRPDKLAGRINRAYVFEDRTLSERGTDFHVDAPDLFYENLFRINEREPAGSGAKAGAAEMKIRDICFRYSKNDKDVLKDLSLSVRSGEIFGLLGGNGAGKTTLLMCAAGGLQPYRGKITGPANRGLLPQNPRAIFVHETVGKDFEKFFEYRGYSRGEAQKELEAIRKILPVEGLESKDTYDLSGGETEICAIAKLLMSGAEVLLFDEPTKGLDVEEKKRLRDIFRKLGEEGKIVIFVTHDEEFALMAATRVGVLSGGIILE
jgi:energy-coupling factor transport system ATP-binding protein